MKTQRLTNGHGSKNGRTNRLFPNAARTWILTIVCAGAVALIVIPLVMSSRKGANAVYVAAARMDSQITPTPIPFEADVLAPACDVLTPEPTAEPTTGMEVSNYTILQENDDYPTVQQLQARLVELGYLDSDEPTTVYNAATTVAVSLFQRTLNVSMDGIATSDLQEYLFSADAMPYEIKLNDSGSDVESMQSRLNELGYYEGKINGYFGVATEEALKAFQTKNKIDVDGIFNVADRDLLYSPDAKPKIDPTPTPSPTPKATKKPSSTKSSSATATPKTTSSSSSSSDSSTTDDSSGSDSSSSTDSTPSYSASYSADGLISVATAMLGYPYSWSEESPARGFDCSGLVYFCLRTCGVSTSRYSASGFSSVSSWGNVATIDELQKGDLLFFKNDTSDRVSHTGIYCGGGSFIHASSSSGKVIRSSISTSYWTRNFVNGRRVF
ncbi:MAG TPA: peptidoglycan-binding protein [Feifaniaceae bacterium]|nr:peptidoglycan-binding protein [Feifaniaceae bacterium]